jgi:hypothetical protein
LHLSERISKAIAGFRGSTRVGPTSTAGSSADDLGGIDGSGYPTSRERRPQLRGRQRFITYNALVADTVIVAAGVRYFLNLIANAEWTFQPAADAKGEPLPGAEEVADFIKDVFNDMESSWSKVVRRAARFRFQGFSWQEWTAKKREDGRIGFLDIEARPCSTIERWDLDEGNSVQGVTQYITGKPETYLPRGKALYIVDDILEDVPEGTGLLRHLIRDADRLRAYEELEALAFETDLRGIPIGRAPLRELRDAVENGRLNVDQVRKARQAVDNFVKNKLLNKNKGATLDSETYNGVTADGGTSPSGTRKWDVELLQGQSQGQADVAKAIDRLNQEMARLLGVEQLMLGSTSTGSLALINGKLSSFFLVVSSTLGEIAEAVERDLVSVICSLNGIDKELWPKAQPQEIDVNDVEAVARVLTDLSSAGAPLQPEAPAVDAVRARVGLPPAPPPPELSEADQMLVDRMRAGIPVNIDPQNPDNNPDNQPGGGPKTKPKSEQDVKPGSEGAAAQQTVSKLLKALLLARPET